MYVYIYIYIYTYISRQRRRASRPDLEEPKDSRGPAQETAREESIDSAGPRHARERSPDLAPSGIWKLGEDLRHISLQTETKGSLRTCRPGVLNRVDSYRGIGHNSFPRMRACQKN